MLRNVKVQEQGAVVTMTAKEYLSGLKKMWEGLQLKEELMQQCFEMATSTTHNMCLSGIRTSSVKNGKVEKYGTMAADLEQEIARDLECYYRCRHEIIQQIQKLDNIKYIKILFKRYVEFKNPEIIACEMDLTPGHVYKLHVKALEEFQRVQLKDTAA